MVLFVPSFSASMIGLPRANVPSSVDLEPHHNLEPIVVENDATEEIRDLMTRKKGYNNILNTLSIT